MTAPALSLATEVLDYESLYSDYQSGLVDRLRGFGPAAECLSLWVPDEDPLTSLRNLWDAAATAGQDEIAILLGADTVARLDADAVLAMAARFGDATLTRGRRCWLVEIHDLHPATPVVAMRGPAIAAVAPASTTTPVARPTHVGIHPLYADAIERAAADAHHEGRVPPSTDLDVLRVQAQGVELELAVDPRTHGIRHAAFTGAPTGHRGLMERFCALLEGVPLLDAADHAVIRLEFALREHWSRRPVPGIVTPRAADPCFELPLSLIREALAAYRARTGYADRTSTWDAGPSARWTALAPAERRDAIRAAVHPVLAERGRSIDDVEVVAIEFDVRLVMRIHAAGDSGRPQLAMDLERAVRDAIDPRLEVVLEEVRDRNKLRRLAIVESTP